MTHLEFENLASDYLEGLLEPGLRASVDEHLAGCADCSEVLRNIQDVIDLCRAAEDVEPRPWLIAKIMRATVGQRQPTWRERIAAFFRPVLQPRVAYPIAMTVFTFSIIVNAAGLNLRNLRVEDLNPFTWVHQANRQGHLMAARAEKFYYDLRVVYEIESRFRQLGGQIQQEEESPKPSAPAGGSSQGSPADQTVASSGGPWVVAAANSDQTLAAAGNQASLTGTRRSPLP